LKPIRRNKSEKTLSLATYKKLPEMQQFRKWNNIVGWSCFAIAVSVYVLTLEPTVSFWDCGEFIASSYKLEVGHPPGAPLFMMMAKVFSLLATDKTKVAMMINAMSALASAFAILFLFWSITHIARKMIMGNNRFDTGKLIAVLGSGFIGALAFTFSDTFWFSAVEAEVYGTSVLFTAVVFWAALKWEDADGPHANRWLILIAYLMGLSIGVHLLNLLTIPAIILIYYFKKHKPTILGFIAAVLISFVILAFVQFGIIAGVVSLAEATELSFVNRLGLPFNSGIIFYVALLIILIVGGLWITYKKRKVIANTILLILTMIILGYGSYAMIVIRSSANPPLDEGNPDNVFAVLSYLNRDQYGDNPLLYGPNYNAPINEFKPGKSYYIKENRKYVISYRDDKYEYDPRFMTFFPRMYSRNTEHINVYKQWGMVQGKTIVINKNGEKVAVNCPTFSENLTFFFTYQLGYMYFRYFLWNFAGRQNELEGNNGILCGNWYTGIRWIDNYFYGPQDKLPTYMKENKGRNKYFCLPLLLGFLGIFYLVIRYKRGFAVVSLLFFMTGMAIVLYLNQTPLQPRERDYAFVGSFYAFSIWIGIGMLVMVELLKKFFSGKNAAIISVVASFVAVPLVMAVQNWDDHDRSGRYTARDVAFDYLNSCAPNAILFTNGDNDTFPLWYLQEVEGIRTDVRVVNLSLLGTDWYINQMKNRAYESAPLPISLTYNKFRQGKREFIYFVEKTKDTIDLKEAVKFASIDSLQNKFIAGTDTVEYFYSHNFTIPVDKKKVMFNGTVDKDLESHILPRLNFSINGNYISKSELIIMDILAGNRWERPVYYVAPNQEGIIGLGNYLQLEGFAYRLVPILTKNSGSYNFGRIETPVMYNNFMNKFRWGSMNEPGVLMDSYNVFTFSVLRMRINFARLADQLYLEGKKDSALQVIDRCMQLMPARVFPPNASSLTLLETAYRIGAAKQARQISSEFAKKCIEEKKFFGAMPNRLFVLIGDEYSTSKRMLERLTEIAERNGDKQTVETLKKQSREGTEK
jgi:MFS family permease